jgi:hypothetical protein
MTSAAPRAWTAPRVRELFYDEARERRWEFDAHIERPPTVSKVEIAAQLSIDQRVADEIEQHGRALFAMAAKLRGSAAGEAPADEEKLSVATIAKMLEVSKDAARAQIKRRGCGVKIGGQWHAPRSALRSLYVRTVRPSVQFVTSSHDPE